MVATGVVVGDSLDRVPASGRTVDPVVGVAGDDERVRAVEARSRC
jgi:hypothetical protein